MSELLTTFTPPPSKLARKTEEKIRAYHRHTNTCLLYTSDAADE